MATIDTQQKPSEDSPTQRRITIPLADLVAFVVEEHLKPKLANAILYADWAAVLDSTERGKS